MKNLIARAETEVNASADKVWDALTNPEQIKEYMFGTKVSSDWKVGSPISWKGEYKGKEYEDKGEILDVTPKKKLSYSHYSPLSGQEDSPENYHTVTIELEEEDGKTNVTLTQDKNGSEKSKEESEKNWKSMLEGLKKVAAKN